MIGVLAVAAGTFALGAPVNLGTTADVDVAVGRIPQGGGSEPVDSVTTTWRPQVTLTYATPRTTWQTAYSQRIWWPVPDPNGTGFPYVTHQASTSLATQLRRTLGANASAVVSAGDVNFFSARDILGPGQSALPVVGAVATNLDGSVGLSWRPVPRWVITGGVSANYFDDYGAIDQLDTAGAVGATVRANFAATRRFGIGPQFSTSYQLLFESEVVDVRPELYLSYRSSRHSNIQATAGVAVLLPVVDGQASSGDPRASGTASLAFDFVGPVTKHVEWGHVGSFSVAPRADRVLDTYLPRLGTTWESIGRAGRDWTFGVRAGFSTNVTDTPLEDNLDETIFGVTLPASYRAHRHHWLGLALYAGARGTHLAASPLQFNEEYSATLTYSYRLGKEQGSGLNL